MDVNDYLEKGINGGPTLKPDEKRRYLGNFYERCDLVVTKKELTLPYLWDALDKELSTNTACLFMHQALDQSIQSKAIQLCQRYQREFTIVTRTAPVEEETVMMVYAEKEAVHIESADIVDKYGNQFNKKDEAPQKEKEGFFKRLFKK